MAKPPATPPSSDIEGPDAGRGAQAGADVADDPGGQLERRTREMKGRPEGTDHRKRSER